MDFYQFINEPDFNTTTNNGTYTASYKGFKYTGFDSEHGASLSLYHDLVKAGHIEGEKVKPHPQAKVVRKLIRECKKQGLQLSRIHDGEESHNARGMTEKQAIYNATGTDQATITFIHPETEQKSVFFLVYGNCDDETIADCSDNDIASSIASTVSEHFE